MESKQPETIEAWIEKATEGLAVSSVEHVRPEIEAHYSEAHEALLQSGLDEAAARDKAIKALGDPKRANKQYCRTYVTKREQNDYRSIGRVFGIILLPHAKDRPYLWMLTVCAFAFFGPALIFVPFAEGKMDLFYWNTGGILAILMITYIESAGVMSLLRNRRPVAAIALLTVTRVAGVFACFLVIFRNLDHWFVILCAVSVGLLTAWSSRFLIRKELGLLDETR